VGLGGLAERCHQAAVVAGARREHDVARLDIVQLDGGEVGAGTADAGRDDGDGLPRGDELELVLDGVDDRAVGRRASELVSAAFRGLPPRPGMAVSSFSSSHWGRAAAGDGD